MAKVIYMDDLEAPEGAPKRVPMYTVDAREVLRLGNKRYRVSSEQGEAAVQGVRVVDVAAKDEAHLSPVDVQTQPRLGVRGGEQPSPSSVNAGTVPSPGGAPTPSAPAQPKSGEPAPAVPQDLAGVVPQGPPSTPGVLVPPAAAVDPNLTHVNPESKGQGQAPAEPKPQGHLG